jgi:4-amino-4-deoxy-L-arabinose transferase-like glycosyltransferase
VFKQNSKTLAWLAIIFVAAGLLYFLTAARDIVVGDTPELITAAATLGVAHPPGYPLFTMIGHLFSLCPFGSIAFRVNLLSVVCDALTIVVIFLTALRLTRSHLAGALAGFILMVNPTFWNWSIVAEVFPLNNLLASTLIYLLVAWHEHPDRIRWLIAALFTTGLGLTNHQTIVLLAPAFCFVLWRRRTALRQQLHFLPVFIAAFFVGLLPYAYVPWASARHPPYNWGNVSSFVDLVDLITRKIYGSTHLINAAGYTGGSAIARIVALCTSFRPLAAALILLGTVQAYRYRRWYLWFSLMAFICAGPLFVWVTDLNLATAPSALFVLQRFFLLPHIVLAPLIAFGTLFIIETITFSAAKIYSRVVAPLAIAGLIAVTATGLTNYPKIDQSHNSIARRFGEDVFATADRHSIFLATGDAVLGPLLYLQTVENLGQHLTVVALPLLPATWYLLQLREHHSDLVIPFDRYDAQRDNLKALVEANVNRKTYFAGTIGNDDHSLDRDYWAYQYGLLSALEPKSNRLAIQEMANDTERLLNSYRPPPIHTVRKEGFESDILMLYTWPPFRIATEYERVGAKDAARQWYERTLALNPDFKPAHDAMIRLGSRTKD